MENLAQSYSGIVTTMIVGHTTSLVTFEEVVLLLLQHETPERRYEDTDDKALIAQDRSKGKPKKEMSGNGEDCFEEDIKKQKKVKKGFYCHQPGHIMKDCRMKKADHKGKGASLVSEHKGDAYCTEELFLVTSPSFLVTSLSVAEVRYVELEVTVKMSDIERCSVEETLS